MGDTHEPLVLAVSAQPAHYAVLGVVTVEPAKAVRRVIPLVTGRPFAIGVIEIAHPALHPRVPRHREQWPVEGRVVVPLAALTELVTHEQQLFPRMAVQQPKIRPQIGKLLPTVPRHLAQQGFFPVHHLVVGQGQHKMLAVGVPHAKGELVVFIAAIQRITGQVIQGVVHPSQIPFVAKAQAAHIGGPRDLGPGGGFFGDGHRAQVVNRFVQPAQKVQRVQVFSPTVAVGNPICRGAGIVQIEHGGHRIHPQGV